MLLLLTLASLAGGCALPRSEAGLHQVITQEIGKPRVGIPQYRCTIGAHRGSSVDFLENTLDAFKAADTNDKYAFIEFDVQYTKDRKMVVFHDRRLLRLFGSLRSVGSSTYAELVEATKGEVCLYTDAMAVLRKRLNIEIKSQGDDEEDRQLADELISDLRQRRRTGSVMISSISPDVLRYINETYPDIPTGKIYWLTRSTYLHLDSLTEGLYGDFEKTQADYLMLHVSNLRNIERLLALKPDGKTIMFWDFEDNMFLVHKDLSDRLWGTSAIKNWFQQMRYGLNKPPLSEESGN